MRYGERVLQPRIERWRFVALVLWAAGVQLHEALGTAGLALFAASFVPELPRLTRVALLTWWPMLAFVAWAICAPMLAGQFPNGAGVARLVDWLTIPLVASFALSEKRQRMLAAVTFTVFAISCLCAGLQHFGWWPPESAFDSLRWTRTSFFRVYERIGESDRFMAGGLLFHRLKFTHVSGLVMVALVASWKRAPRLVLPLAAFGFIALWIFPAARMGAVAMTVAVGFVVVFTSKRPVLAFGIATAVALVGLGAMFSIAPLRERFVSAFSDQGSGQRTQHLAAGLEAIRQHPIVGVGAGQFRPSKFGGPEMAEHVRDNPGKAHLQFVSMAAESGVIGGLAFFALLIWLAFKARGRPLAILTFGALVHFTVLSLAHDPLFQAPYSMSLVLLIGLGMTHGGARSEVD